GIAQLTYDGYTPGAHHLIEEVGEGGLQLSDFGALVTLDVLAPSCRDGRGSVACDRVQHGTRQVSRVLLNGHVGAIADFTRPRGPGRQGGREAQAVQADVFGVFEVVAAVAENHTLRQTRARSRNNSICVADDVGNLCCNTQAGSHHPHVRRTAVIVHHIGTALGRITQPAQRQPPLAGITSVAITGALKNHTLGIHQETDATSSSNRLQPADGRTAHVIVVVTAILYHVVAEEGAAVIGNSLVPFELVEGFQGELVCQALRNVDHIDRNQAFLDLGARTAERSGIDGVDAVDAVADEGAFTPAHYLAAQADATRQIAQRIVVVEEGVEDL